MGLEDWLEEKRAKSEATLERRRAESEASKARAAEDKARRAERRAQLKDDFAGDLARVKSEGAERRDALRAERQELRGQQAADKAERQAKAETAKKSRQAQTAAWSDMRASMKADHRHDTKYEDLKVKGDRLHKGMKSWPVAECEAMVDQGVAIAPRLTASRVALTGPFALLLKKDRSKVYLAITVPGDAILMELKGKQEGEARQFATKLNLAAEHHRAASAPAEAPAANAAVPAPAIPPGWYPNGNVQQYWDGTSWTDQTAPLASP